MKKIIVFLLLVLVSRVNAQEDTESEFEKFRQQQNREFNEYVSKQDKAFADFLKKEWELFQSMVMERPVEVPKPKTPPVAVIPDKKIPVIPGPIVKPLPVAPIPPPKIKPQPVNPTILPQKLDFSFYGYQLNTAFSSKLKIDIDGVSEASVSDYWQKMSATPYKEFVDELKNHSIEMGLNGWGYYKLVDAIAAKKFTGNSRVMFCFFMLRQGGYDVRIGRADKSLRLLMSIKENVYGMSYFVLDGKKYYCFGEGETKSLYTYDKGVVDENCKMVSLQQESPLNIGENNKVRQIKLAKNTELEVSIPYNSVHIAYYNDVPQTDLAVYFANKLPIETQEILLDFFKELGKDKSLPEFVGMLLNFVQTSFDYKTDNDQFGREKYFYPEEILAYPFSDCEDRSVFFARLVTDLTGVSVVGLLYPGHASTAVNLGDVNVAGNMITWKNKKYVSCDPTYVNASIGMTMPRFKTVNPKIVEIKTDVN